MKRSSATLTLVVALAVPAAAPAPAPAAFVDCHVFAYYPNLLVSSARNMTCAAAKRDLKRHKKGISRTFRTPGGFRCRRVSGGELGGQWRCVKGAKAYRFEFGD